MKRWSGDVKNDEAMIKFGMMLPPETWNAVSRAISGLDKKVLFSARARIIGEIVLAAAWRERAIKAEERLSGCRYCGGKTEIDEAI